MGQTVCRYVYSSSHSSADYWNAGGTVPGRKSTTTTTTTTTTQAPRWVCEWKKWPILTLLSSDPIYTLLFAVVSVLLLALLWIVTFCIKFKDFTRTYIISNLIPSSVGMLFLVVIRLNAILHFFGYSIEAYVQLAVSIASTTQEVNFHLSTFFFLLYSVVSARRRETVKRDWIVFGVCFIVSLLYGVYVGLSYDYNTNMRVFWYMSGLVGVMQWVVLFSWCCCTAPRRSMLSPEPSLSNARSRLGWHLLYTIVAAAPMNAVYSLSLFYSYNDVFLDILLILDHTVMIIFPVSALLLLPAYRSALFCSQGYSSRKVTDLEAVKPQVTMIGREENAVPATQSAPVPHGLVSPAPVRREVTHSINPPVPAPLPAPILYATSMPPQPTYLFPSNVIPAEQYHLVPSQPSLMTQHHVVSTPAPALTHHLVSPAPVAPQFLGTPVAPANLMRFASQPNLTAMTSLQPAVSTPQLNFVTHSPFYIPN